MASNVSDDGSPPLDFKLSSTVEGSENKISVASEICSLCKNLRNTFYCKICIANGDFVSSTPQNPERFADKKLLWLKLKGDKQLLSNKCMKVFEKMEVKTRLQSEINLCKGRIKLLLQIIKKKNEIIKKTNKDIEMIKEKNLARTLRLPRNKERVEKLENYVANNMRTEIKQRKSKVARAEQELKKIVQKNIKDLIHYIFPLSKIDAISKSAEELESTDTVTALAEATRTSYVRGKWVLMDSSGDLHYRIVAPTLPGSGDYSAYSDWVAANKNSVPGNEKLNENQAYNISAALCYTTQLVNLLAFYLDVLLPNRISYVDFYSTDISDNKFYKKISKLNTNILYLCFSQGVNTSLLNPKHTLCNLLHLVNHSHLGRTEPFEIDSALVFSLENWIPDSKTEENSEDEENDVPSEWEAIPLVPCPENSPGSAVLSTQQMPSMHATTSMAGGLVTSLASMWRGWTGNRPFKFESNIKSAEEFSRSVLKDQERFYQAISSAFTNESPSLLHDSLIQRVGNVTRLINSTFPSSTVWKGTLLQNLFNSVVGNSASPKEIDIENPAQMTPTNIKETLNKPVCVKRKSTKCRGRPRKRPATNFSGKARGTRLPVTNLGEMNCTSMDKVQNRSETQPSSPESVSLLRDCYEERITSSQRVVVTELTKICEKNNTNPDDECIYDWELTRIPLEAFDEDMFDRNNCGGDGGDEGFFAMTPLTRANKSCQTDLSIFQSDLKTHKLIENTLNNHTGFIESIIRLKQILSSTTQVSDKEVYGAINGKRKIINPDKEINGCIVPTDTLKYLLRSTNVDVVLENTVSSLLRHLEIALEKDFENLAMFWKNSMYEVAVDLLAEVTGSEPKLRILVDSFLEKIIMLIMNGETRQKNIVQETRTVFLIKLSNSPHSCQDAINRIIEKLKLLPLVKHSRHATPTDKYDWVRLAKNSYFLLRTLHVLLLSFGERWEKSKKKEESTVSKPASQNYDVIQMWRKHWRQADVLIEEKTDQNECESIACKWSSDLDEILIHCVDRAPILAGAVERCATLAKNVVTGSNIMP